MVVAIIWTFVSSMDTPPPHVHKLLVWQNRELMEHLGLFQQTQKAILDEEKEEEEEEKIGIWSMGSNYFGEEDGTLNI